MLSLAFSIQLCFLRVRQRIVEGHMHMMQVARDSGPIMKALKEDSSLQPWPN